MTPMSPLPDQKSLFSSLPNSTATNSEATTKIFDMEEAAKDEQSEGEVAYNNDDTFGSQWRDRCKRLEQV